MGRSAETIRLKLKPDKEGYKFLALCCSVSGYCYSFFPDGRLQKKTTLENVVKLVDTLPKRTSLKYVLTMDNFFNQPVVIKAVRERNVGSIGTFRRQRSWPPREYKRVVDPEYNKVHLLDDKRNFLMMRWIDNGEVDMLTTVHDGYETVRRLRKRPRETQINSRNVRRVWGSDWGKTIHIPQVIDDYNNTMGAVDKAYQMISNYKPKLRCRRTWMPMFLHALDICRLNSWVIAKNRKRYKTQQDFLLCWIHALNMRAEFEDRKRTRSAIEALASPPIKPPPAKRIRLGKHNLQLPQYRLAGTKE
jgi:hypothetical protein